MGQIPLTKPHLTAHDEKEILSCLRSTWISSKSPYVNQFEEQFAKNVSKTTYAVALNSGTSALFIALKSLGIGPGDEVILPSFTMIATINAVVWTGAKPVLATCTSKQDWSINPDDIEQKITKKTKAIIPVHIYGFTCDMQAICDLARKNGIFVVEDAAEAVGSLYQNKPVGSLGDIGCFSLFSNKIITTGNGGVLTTNNKKVYDMATRLSFFDFNPKDHYLHRLIAFNLVMTGLQAALGISQIRQFETHLQKRIAIANQYKKRLDSWKSGHFLQPIAASKPNYWFPALICKSSTLQKKIRASLEKEHIETRAFFRPIHKQPAYKNLYSSQSFPHAEHFWQRGILLPSFHTITTAQINRVCDVIASC